MVVDGGCGNDDYGDYFNDYNDNGCEEGNCDEDNDYNDNGDDDKCNNDMETIEKDIISNIMMMATAVELMTLDG